MAETLGASCALAAGRMKRHCLAAVLIALLSLAGCSDKTPPAPGSGAPPMTNAKALASSPQAHVPGASAWAQVSFDEMKLTYRRPPSLAEGQTMIAGAQAGKGGDQVWGMAVKTNGGLDVVLLELKIGSSERAKWLTELRSGVIAGEVVFADGDAVVKYSRVVGKKAGDTPALSTTHVDMRACKRLGDVEYCFDIDGAVELALGRAGVDPATAMDLVAMVRSLERLPNPK